jgi:peptidoglycan/xylan/chitin deacetylase (PgdA/CDA1 family)
MNTIALTFDIDWAPESVVADSIEILDKFGLKYTIFATNESAILKSLDTERYEIGLHPNFNPLLAGQNGSIDTILDELRSLYPNAVGVRCHSLVHSTRLVTKFGEQHLLYESNCYLPYPNVQPFVYPNGLISIPYNWADDYHCAFKKSFANCDLDLSNQSLKIFGFHPVHIYLNTQSQTHYDEAKTYYHNPEVLRQHRNTSSIPGTRDLLLAILNFVKQYDIRTVRLKDIALDVLQTTAQETLSGKTAQTTMY